MEYLDELKRTIEQSERCSARHIGTVPVVEVFRGQTAWEGEVEVFELTGHPKAEKCYAWGFRKSAGFGWEITTVLEILPVDSPQMAVRIAIAAEARSLRAKR